MDIDDFIRHVALEPERVVTRTVLTPEADALAKATTPGGLSMMDLLSTPGGHSEQREIRYRHILGPPASAHAIDSWQLERSVLLPRDLRELVSRVNGIHLWAEAESRRAYLGLAPIEEWELARIKMFGEAAERSLLDDRYVAISYHGDSAAYVALDLKTGRYFLMDSAAPDATTPIANDAGELLDWLWQRRIVPKE